MDEKEIKLSVVVPVYNEEGSVADLYKEIVGVLNNIGLSYEIIFVDDGSTDKTSMVLKDISPLKIISFRRNFGQTSAMDAGIKESKGEYIITMDGDGQNDPADILNLIRELEDNDFDAVSGWRKDRHDPFLKRFFSRCAAILRKFLIDDGIHDSGCTMKIYKRECFEGVDLTGEMHRFIPALLKIRGFKIGEIVVNHRPRAKGKTKYFWTRSIKGILDMLSVWFWKKYSGRPLHLFGGIGVFLIITSIFAGLWALYEKIFYGFDLSDTFLTTLAMFGILMGAQFFIFGLLADMILKNYFMVKNDFPYSIKEIIDIKNGR